MGLHFVTFVKIGHLTNRNAKIMAIGSGNNAQEIDNKAMNKFGGNVTEFLTMDTFKDKVFNFEANQEWKFEGDLPCLIDFYADWCGPCKAVAPVLEDLSREYAGKVNIYKIDTEAEQQLAAMFGIRSIPSLLFVPKDGKPQMAVGALPKDSLVKAIDEVLGVPANSD